MAHLSVFRFEAENDVNPQSNWTVEKNNLKWCRPPVHPYHSCFTDTPLAHAKRCWVHPYPYPSLVFQLVALLYPVHVPFHNGVHALVPFFLSSCLELSSDVLFSPARSFLLPRKCSLAPFGPKVFRWFLLLCLVCLPWNLRRESDPLATKTRNWKFKRSASETCLGPRWGGWF